MKKSLLAQCTKIAQDYRTKHPEWNHFLHYCFIVQANAIVEWATNRTGPPLTHRGYPPSGKQHAEPLAWFKARGLLTSHRSIEAVNIRLNRQGELRLSKPCACCYSFLHSVGCRTVWFSTDAGFAKISLV